MARLAGKVAVITGAGSGIGKATAVLFASEGAKVIVADWILEGAEETIRSIRVAGGEATFVKADVSKSTDVENMFKTTIGAYGQLDILFNNAGIGQMYYSVEETPEDVWDRVINVNLKGVFLGMKYGIPHMLDKGGSIINSASTGALVGFSYFSPYCASKGGVLALTRAVAHEYAGRNIRINCICPGVISTPLIERVRSSPKWETIASTRPQTPMGRLGKPEEIAHAVLFLASDESSYATGTALIIDGGYTAI